MRLGPILVFALLTLVPMASAGRTPLVRVGNSTDAWEASVGTAECSAVAGDRVFIVEPEQVSTSVSRLEHSSLIALTQQDATELLGVARNPSFATLQQQLLAGRIAILSEQRRVVYAERHGSWSLADENNLADLNQLLANIEQGSLNLYLVRALAADAGQVSRFEVAVCGDIVLTRSYPNVGTGSRGEPDRTALVVLLDGTPQSTAPEWTYDDPSLNR